MLKCTKKIVLGAVSMFSLITMCGCSAKLPFTQKQPDLGKGCTMSAEITCGKLTAAANVTRAGVNEWEFSFTEPKQLNGITLSLNEKGYSASLGGLSFSADENAAYAMLPEIISVSIDSLSKCTSEDFVQNDGILTVDTEFEGKKVVVTADEKSGHFISLKCPYHKLSVNFSGQKSYQKPAEPDPDEGGLVPDD